MFKILGHLKQARQFFSVKNNYLIFSQIYEQNKTLIKKQKAHADKSLRLLAVYDFLDLPYTSDINAFILNANVERRQRGLAKIDLVLVTNDKYPANPAYEKRITHSNYRHLIYNMAIEYSRLYEYIGSVMLLEDRQQAIQVVSILKRRAVLFPADYDPNLPGERMTYFDRPVTYHFPNYVNFAKRDPSYISLQVPPAIVQLARKWLKRYVYPKVPVTITLREAGHVQSERANTLSEWQKLIQYYEHDERIVFIVLRDFYNVYEEDVFTGNNVIHCNEAVISNVFRAALHQEASLNLFIPTGVNIVSTLSRNTRYIQFKMLTEEVNVTSEKMIKKLIGIGKGENWPSASKYQKNVWKNDDFDVLKEETSKMLSLLESDGRLYPDFYEEQVSDVKSLETETEQSMGDLNALENVPSPISQRPNLRYYLIVFRVKKLIDWLTFYVRKYILGFPYKTLDKMQLDAEQRILFYGFGTVSKQYIDAYRNNVLGVIDASYTNKEEKFEGLKGYPPTSIPDLDFDYIVVTPKYREETIIEQLTQQYQIRKSKFLVVSSDVYRR